MEDDADRLINAAIMAGTEEHFLEVLRGCGQAEVWYTGSERMTVLMQIALRHDWPKATAALIDRGCNVNATNKDGDTALHYAGYRDRRETARVLLERGADRTIKGERGRTAADNARIGGKENLAAYIDGAHALPPRPRDSHSTALAPPRRLVPLR